MKGTTLAGTVVAAAVLTVITVPTVAFLGLLGLGTAAYLQHRKNKQHKDGN